MLLPPFEETIFRCLFHKLYALFLSKKKKKRLQPSPAQRIVKEKVQLQGNSQVIVMKFPSFLLGHYKLNCKPFALTLCSLSKVSPKRALH